MRYASAYMRCLLVTPPMIQLNTPYPATAYLTGFLRQHQARLGLELAQADAALELFLRVFSHAGIQRVTIPSAASGTTVLISYRTATNQVQALAVPLRKG